jgi:hypothetical protein
MTREIVTAFALATLLSGCPKQKPENVLFIDRDIIELPDDDELDADSELPEAGDTGENQ